MQEIRRVLGCKAQPRHHRGRAYQQSLDGYFSNNSLNRSRSTASLQFFLPAIAAHNFSELAAHNSGCLPPKAKRTVQPAAETRKIVAWAPMRDYMQVELARAVLTAAIGIDAQNARSPLACKRCAASLIATGYFPVPRSHP